MLLTRTDTHTSNQALRGHFMKCNEKYRLLYAHTQTFSYSNFEHLSMQRKQIIAAL